MSGKGYAAYTGVNDGSEEWRKRAKGWIKVMKMDAIVAMVIYTLVTAAFYLLGASVLHGRQEIPEGNAVIDTLANIYTQTLGSGVRNAYLIGAFFVLYSSVFATLAYWSRLFMDIFSSFQWIDPNNENKIQRCGHPGMGNSLSLDHLIFIYATSYLYGNAWGIGGIRLTAARGGSWDSVQKTEPKH